MFQDPSKLQKSDRASSEELKELLGLIEKIVQDLKKQREKKTATLASQDIAILSDDKQAILEFMENCASAMNHASDLCLSTSATLVTEEQRKDLDRLSKMLNREMKNLYILSERISQLKAKAKETSLEDFRAAINAQKQLILPQILLSEEGIEAEKMIKEESYSDPVFKEMQIIFLDEINLQFKNNFDELEAIARKVFISKMLEKLKGKLPNFKYDIERTYQENQGDLKSLTNISTTISDKINKELDLFIEHFIEENENDFDEYNKDLPVNDQIDSGYIFQRFGKNGKIRFLNRAEIKDFINQKKAEIGEDIEKYLRPRASAESFIEEIQGHKEKLASMLLSNTRTYCLNHYGNFVLSSEQSHPWFKDSFPDEFFKSCSNEIEASLALLEDKINYLKEHRDSNHRIPEKDLEAYISNCDTLLERLKELKDKKIQIYRNLMNERKKIDKFISETEALILTQDYNTLSKGCKDAEAIIRDLKRQQAEEFIKIKNNKETIKKITGIDFDKLSDNIDSPHFKENIEHIKNKLETELLHHGKIEEDQQRFDEIEAVQTQASIKSPKRNLAKIDTDILLEIQSELGIQSELQAQASSEPESFAMHNKIKLLQAHIKALQAINNDKENLELAQKKLEVEQGKLQQNKINKDLKAYLIISITTLHAESKKRTQGIIYRIFNYFFSKTFSLDFKIKKLKAAIEDLRNTTTDQCMREQWNEIKTKTMREKSSKNRPEDELEAQNPPGPSLLDTLEKKRGFFSLRPSRPSSCAVALRRIDKELDEVVEKKSIDLLNN